MKFSNVLLAATAFFGGSALALDNSLALGVDDVSESMITVGFMNPTGYDAEFNPEEQQFLASALVNTFKESHDDSDVGLTDVTFEGQTHEPVDGSDLDSDLTEGLGKRKRWDYAYDTTRFFRRRRLSEADTSVVEASDKSPHQLWEKKLCKELTGSSYPVFQHVEKCTIGFVPIGDSVITVGFMNPTDYDAEFNQEEQQFLSSLLVKAYKKSHEIDDGLDLTDVSFGGQTHEPADDSSGLRASRKRWDYAYDTTRFFRRRRFTEAYISAMEVSELDAKSARQLWEKKLCKGLAGSNFPVFQHVEKCTIKFESATSAAAME